MNNSKSNIADVNNTARIVGILFVIGTAAGIISLSMAGPIIHASDYLLKLSMNDNKIIVGAFSTIIMGISLSMIPIVLFPIFRKYSEALALGAVIFRGALELLAYLGIAFCWLLLLALSKMYVSGDGTAVTENIQLIGMVLLEVQNKFTNLLDIVFSIGALFIYYLFYKTKLIPNWLSICGFIGAILYLSYPIISILGYNIGILQFPLAVQEMIMAGVLLIKGFSTKAHK